ncbi:MAG: alpha/beta hydrolase [Gemmatimonadota bacterium]
MIVLRLAGFLLVGVVLLYFMITPRVAEFLLFFPSRADPGPAPVLAGIRGEDLGLVAADGTRIHGWWFEAEASAPAVLFLHGNAGHIGMRAFQAEGMLQEGVSILLLSYRGYGRSQGRPSEAGVVMDAEAGLDWLLERIPGERIVVHGRSLGGAVAAGLARRRPEPAGLILESTFTDLAEIGKAAYPIFPTFLLRRLQGHYDARAGVRAWEGPVMITHGDRDGLIPVRMGRELRDVAQQRPREAGALRYLEVTGAGHNDLPFEAGPDYFRETARFIREATQGDT